MDPSLPGHPFPQLKNLNFPFSLSLEKQEVKAKKALGAGRTRNQTRSAGDKILLQNRRWINIPGGVCGGEGICNKQTIPGKEIFPHHVFQVPVSSPLCSSWIIKDHLEEPTKSHSTFGLFTAIFSPLSKTAEAPTKAKLSQNVPGDRGWRDLPLSHVSISTTPLSRDFSPKTAALSHQYKPRAVHSVHRKIKE